MSGNSKKKRERPQHRKKVYWDTCVFLAWIKDEQHWPEDVRKGIAQTVEMAISGEVTIVTSALTLSEILESKMTTDDKLRFATIFSAPYLQLVDLDRKISARCAAIRESHDTRTYGPDGKLTSGGMIRTPDAIHLATAVHMNVAVLNTLDGSGRHPKSQDMLRLDGNVGGFQLSIKQPAFIEPPKFSEGPIEPVSGLQGNLFNQAELTDDKTTPQKVIPITSELRRRSDGHPQDQALTEAAKAEKEAVPQNNPEELADLDLSKDLEVKGEAELSRVVAVSKSKTPADN